VLKFNFKNLRPLRAVRIKRKKAVPGLNLSTPVLRMAGSSLATERITGKKIKCKRREASPHTTKCFKSVSLKWD
jgi:hypothetical protein